MSKNQSIKVEFAGALGHKLAARLEKPASNFPKSYAIFAHCFTCSKDVFAANRIAQALAAKGIAVLRFDFTGLGRSEGNFADTNFSSNVGDLKAAADYLAREHKAPSLLIGHSLGGAAVLVAANALPSVKAVVTIGAPADPAHVTHAFQANLDQIIETGSAKVDLAGRPFTIQKQFVDDLKAQNPQQILPNLKTALLVMHAPTDATVGISNAADIFTAAKHPKSFVSLDGADHLLTNKQDAIFAADVISSWADRYINSVVETKKPEIADGAVLVSETGLGKFQQQITVGSHTFLADEPKSVGGLDTGPAPYDFLLAGLGACTAMTIRMYADFKKVPLEHVSVRLSHQKIHASDCQDCETKNGKIDEIERSITLVGTDLSQSQREKLLEIADKCPVHRSLESENKIRTELAS